MRSEGGRQPPMEPEEAGTPACLPGGGHPPRWSPGERHWEKLQ